MNDKYARKKTWLLYPLVIIPIVIVVLVCWYCCFQSVTTVLVIRHAEKGTSPPSDPPLSPAGEERAQSLVHVSGEAGITAIFATEYLRTQQTVEPLAEHLGLTVNEVDAVDVEGLINQILADHSGEVVIIAGHSNTVPLIIEELGGDPISPIDESEYDNLYVVTVFRFGSSKVLNLKYGNPS